MFIAVFGLSRMNSASTTASAAEIAGKYQRMPLRRRMSTVHCTLYAARISMAMAYTHVTNGSAASSTPYCVTHRTPRMMSSKPLKSSCLMTIFSASPTKYSVQKTMPVRIMTAPAPMMKAEVTASGLTSSSTPTMISAMHSRMLPILLVRNFFMVDFLPILRLVIYLLVWITGAIRLPSCSGCS